MGGKDNAGIEAIGALADGVRRALYDIVVDADHPVGRDEAAEAVGVARQMAAYHLDRLAEEGLLDVSYERLSGRTGPGAGRPAKLYQRSDAEHDVTLPPRRYLLAARILLEAVAGEGGGERGRGDDEELDRLSGVARRTGQGLAKGGWTRRSGRTGTSLSSAPVRCVSATAPSTRSSPRIAGRRAPSTMPSSRG